MRDRLKQRVICSSCGWAGGRAASGNPVAMPCSKCGAAVQRTGEVYLENRRLACCPACDWWGEVAPARLAQACRRCDGPLQQAFVVTETGKVVA